MDEPRSFSVAFLDLWIYKGPRFKACRKPDFAQRIKKTAVHVALSSHNLHPRGTHEGWLLSVMARMHNLSLHRTSPA